jgi:hypothetical protein
MNESKRKFIVHPMKSSRNVASGSFKGRELVKMFKSYRLSRQKIHVSGSLLNLNRSISQHPGRLLLPELLPKARTADERRRHGDDADRTDPP